MKSVFGRILLCSTALIAAVSAYSRDIGNKAAYFSAATHCSVNSLKSWTCGNACNQQGGVQSLTPIINDARGTFGYVAYSSKTNEIVVAFRGSANVQNWITNIDFAKQAYSGVSGAEVHTGFYKAYNDVSGQVINAVSALQKAHSGARFFVTGHSLGGALATFAAVDIKKRFGGNGLTLYTFGSPRTGNLAFTDYVYKLLGGGAYQRITHYNDVVPHLPPTAFGFNHAGDEIWYFNQSPSNDFKTCPANPGKTENTGCSDSILATGTAAHLVYLGIELGSQCSSYNLMNVEHAVKSISKHHHHHHHSE